MIGLDTKIRILLGFQGQTRFLEHKRFPKAFLGHFFRISVSRPCIWEPRGLRRSRLYLYNSVHFRYIQVCRSSDTIPLCYSSRHLRCNRENLFCIRRYLKKHKIRQIVKKKKKGVRRGTFFQFHDFHQQCILLQQIPYTFLDPRICNVNIFLCFFI